MPELARLYEVDAPTPLHPLWLPDKESLAARPIEKAYAIDPKNPLEIDDAIKTEHVSDSEHRVSVFISDIGLIEHEVNDLNLARKKGWTRYARNDEEKDITMFDEAIYVPLGLDQKHYQLGAPALKISFSLNPQTGSWGDVIFDRVTVQTHCYAYHEVDKALKNTKGAFDRLIDTGGAILRLLESESSAIDNEQGCVTPEKFSHLSSTDSKSKELVARFMVAANFIVAAEMDRRQVPWLFRNHGLESISRLERINDEDKKLFTHFMKAVYGPDRIEHLGLGLWAYCHTTSGLRRFADTANSLNLASIIEGRSEPVFDEAEMKEIGYEMTEIYRKEMVRASRKRAA